MDETYLVVQVKKLVVLSSVCGKCRNQQQEQVSKFFLSYCTSVDDVDAGRRIWRREV